VIDDNNIDFISGLSFCVFPFDEDQEYTSTIVVQDNQLRYETTFDLIVGTFTTSSTAFGTMESYCGESSPSVWNAIMVVPEAARVYTSEEQMEVIEYCRARSDFFNNQFMLFDDIISNVPEMVDEAYQTGDSESGREIAISMEEISHGMTSHINNLPNPKAVEEINNAQFSAFQVLADAFSSLGRYFDTGDETYYEEYQSLGNQFNLTFNNASDLWHEVAYQYDLDPFDCEN
jgi:hypothetical protein